jgi:Mrp family chromosome partitioning ATPase
MGRMLEALRQAGTRRNGDGEAPPAEDDFISDFANEEVPFIEVGPERSVEASPAVLGAEPPRLRLAAPPAEPLPAAVVSLRPPLSPNQRFARELVAFHQPDAPAAAEYRRLAAALFQGAIPGPAHVLLCAGVAAGSGATTVALNLGIGLAGRDGRNVIIVDAECAQPAVAERLGLRARPGLADVLAGRESLDRALQETGLENLTALAAGVADGEWRASHSGEAFRPVLRLLRDRFDVVLIDGGLEVGGVAEACDAAYLVVSQAAAGAAATAERARSLLRQGVPLRGCIVTALPA